MSSNDAFVIKEGTLIEYTGQDNVIIVPDGVHEIGEKTFYKNKIVKKVILPEGLKTIAPMAFQESSISEIVFPKTLLSIEYNAFKSCANLTKVLLEEGIQSIGEDAFINCTSLSEIVIPKTVKTIENNAFDISEEDKGQPAVHRKITIKGKPKFEENTFGYSSRTRQIWLDYMEGKYPYDFVIADNIPLFQLLFEKESPWYCFLSTEKEKMFCSMFLNPSAYHKGDILYWVKKIKASKKDFLPYVLKKTDMATFNGALSCGVVDNGNAAIALEIVGSDSKRKALIIKHLGGKSSIEDKSQEIEEKKAAEKAKAVAKKADAIKQMKEAHLQKAAEEIEKEWKTVDYKQGRYISAYLGDEINIVIPSRIQGKAIIGVDYEAFRAEGSFSGSSSPFGSSNKKNAYQKKMYQLRIVVLAEGIQQIGRRAFWGCTYLSEVHIPESVCQIDPSAFESCKKLTIFAPSGSFAEQYASSNDIPFQKE